MVRRLLRSSQWAALAAGGALLMAPPASAESLESDAALGALPEDAESASLARLRSSGVIVDVTAQLGSGLATVSEDGAAIAELATGCFDAKLGIGTFLGPAVKVGLEATVGDRRVMGGVEVLDENALAARSAIEGDTWYVLPLGAYLELYPWRDVGVFLGLHAGVGTFWPAEYLTGGNIEIAGAASVELGYERELTDGARGALLLRYGVTGFGRTYIDEDYSSTLNSNEVSLAARVSLF